MNNLNPEAAKHFLYMSYNLQIMDVLFMVLVVGLIGLVALAKIRNQRTRLEAIEKHLNISSAPKKA